MFGSGVGDKRPPGGADSPRALRFDTRLPELPFLSDAGFLAFAHWDYVYAGEIATVLRELSVASGDAGATVTFIEWSAGPDRVEIEIAGRDLTAESYQRALADAPPDAVNWADVVAIAGHSQAWAVWAERGWELALLWSTSVPDCWLQSPMSVITTPEEALDDCAYAYSSAAWRASRRELDAAFVQSARRYQLLG